MKNIGRLETDGFEVRVGNAEVWLGDVALDQYKTIKRRAGKIGDLLDLLHRLLNKLRLDEQVKLSLGPDESFDQTTGNKSGKTCDKDRFSVEHSDLYILASLEARTMRARGIVVAKFENLFSSQLRSFKVNDCNI